MTMETSKEKIEHAEATDLVAKMLKSSLGLVRPFFDDPEVVEIMLNPDRHLWVERIGQPCKDTGILISTEESTRVIKLVATYCHTVVTENNPILSAELPNFGSRFEAVLPPVTTAPVFSIRQPAKKLFDLQDYIDKGIMTPQQVEIIKQAVKDRKNILFVGGTGTGKTTATNAVLDEIAKTGDRILILEDTRELQCSAPNAVFLRTQDNIGMTRLLKSTMRLRPDRIVVGEVRDGAALALLKAWNTGHPGGISTIHADNAYAGLLRLESLIQEAIPSPQPQLIVEAVDIVIYIERVHFSRKVKEMAFVNGYKDGVYQLEYIKG